MTMLIYRAARYTSSDIAQSDIDPAARLPRELIYRGLRHDGLVATSRPVLRALTYRGVAFVKTPSGQIVPNAARAAAAGALSAAMA